jgi:hypothetical protein
VPGLLLWASLVVTNIAIPLRLRRAIPASWRRGNPGQRFLSAATLYIPVAQIGFAVTAFFVSFAWMEPLYMLTAIVAGLTVVVRRERLTTLPAPRAAFRSKRVHAWAAIVPPTSPAPKTGT